MYDILIIGCGPAGMTSAIYGARNGLKVGIIEKNAPGGAMVNTNIIENYPGYNSINGTDLSMKMFEQVTNLGIDFLGYEVLDVKKDKDIFNVITQKETFLSKTVILALGTIHKKLGVPNEDKFSGRGISWCAVCDGNFYKNKNVAVIGGGNSAFEEALYLTNICNTVYLIHRREEFRADQSLVKKLQEKNNVKFILNTTIKEFDGKDKLEKILLINLKSSEEKWLEIDGCFEYVGQNPASEIVQNLGITDDNGYVLVNSNFETKIKGLFAAGDIIKKEIRQIVTAVNDGAIAALNACRYCK